MNRDIEIHIDELVLHGFGSNDVELISKAVEMELTRLLTLNGLPASFSLARSHPQIDAGEFTMSTYAKPGNVGNNIAGLVYKGFKNHKSPIKK